MSYCRIRSRRKLWLLGQPSLLAFFIAIAASCLLVVNARAGSDVSPGQTGNEPTTGVVNPRNPSQVAVVRGCQVRISNDYGQTFPVVRNTTVAPCNGDPSLAYDSQGRLFVTHLSTQGGELLVFAGQIADTTTAGNLNYTPIQISTADGNADDKQWLAADANPVSPYRDNLYLVWTQLSNPSRILFSRSTNQGVTWSAPQSVSANGENFVWPSHVAVGINGDVYVAYHTDTCGAANAGTVSLLRDGNGGANFAAGTVPQKNDAFGAGQATVTCNVQDNPLSGDEIPGADFWLQGTVQPWILPDPARAGHVYVVANDDPNNAYANGDDADVVIALSTDNGVTFTQRRVDNSPGQSFTVMPTAHIDQDGNIAVHWYDNRRNQTNTGANANFGTPNFLLDLYGTTSKDGGQTFAPDFRISDNAFDPDVNPPCRFGALNTNNCTERIGEYNGVWTVDGIGYTVWTGNATAPAAPFPADGAGAQTTLFDLFSMLGVFADRLEPNESRDFAVVAALGANDTYNEKSLSLHTATDVDFFKVAALHTGKLEVDVSYNERIAGLQVRVHDTSGDVIATSTRTTVQTGSSIEKVVIPAVQGQLYFVEVLDPNAPNTVAPQSLYDLTIVNRAAPVPFGLDLQAASDSGRNDADDVTNDSTPTISIRADMVDAAASGIALLAPVDVAAGLPGYAVAVFDNGVFAGYASPVAGSNGTVWEITLASPLSDGTHSITAKVRVFDSAIPPANGFGGESASLLLNIDTLPPTTPNAPDLLASSDSAGINDDNITTITTPKFVGTGERNALIRIAANTELVGQSVLTSGGAYEVTTIPLADGVYDITAVLEDLAGNVSAPSAALRVTIANQVLNLHGATSGPASALVRVDLAAGTVAGYPGIAGATGLAGIVGIPSVNLDTNGQALTVLGTPGNDGLYYTPLGGTAGTVTRDGSPQVLNFFNAAGAFTIDPLGGSDTVSTIGSVQVDKITALANANTTVQVNALKVVNMPIANVERLTITAGQGNDTINVAAYATVNANLFVDAGEPTTNPPNGDSLNLADASGKAQVKTQPGGAVPNSGSILVDYSRTTGNLTRVDYVNAEKVKIVKNLSAAGLSADDAAAGSGDSIFLPLVSQ